MGFSLLVLTLLVARNGTTEAQTSGSDDLRSSLTSPAARSTAVDRKLVPRAAYIIETDDSERVKQAVADVLNGHNGFELPHGRSSEKGSWSLIYDFAGGSSDWQELSSQLFAQLRQLGLLRDYHLTAPSDRDLPAGLAYRSLPLRVLVRLTSKAPRRAPAE